MTPRPLSVAIVSDERQLLRELSWFLSAFGYEVLTSTDSNRISSALNKGDVDILLADHKVIDLDESDVLKQATRQNVHTILLSDEKRLPSVVDAAESGITDLLVKPICNGEMLSRLRAGARVCEFGRRIAEQSTRDDVTGLRSRAGLLYYLRSLSSDDVVGSESNGIMMIDVDFFDHVNHQHGHEAGNDVLRAIGAIIVEVVGPRAAVARIEADRFAVVYRTTSEDECGDLAEKLREAIEGLSLSDVGAGVACTASLSYGLFDCGDLDPLELIERAAEALSHAKQSGKNASVRIGEFDKTFAQWRKELREGNPFGDATARDVMQPFAVVLNSGSTSEVVAQQIRESAVEYVPLVDRKNSLVGVVHSDDFQPHGADEAAQSGTASGLAIQSPTTLSEDATFGEIVECFADDENPMVVVVRNREPRGLITRDGFLSLIEPINTGTFRPLRPFTASSEYLAVPDVVEADECLA